MRRWLVLACVLWIVSPLDGDWVPVVGWIDDAAAGLVALATTWQGLKAKWRTQGKLPSPTAGWQQGDPSWRKR